MSVMKVGDRICVSAESGGEGKQLWCTVVNIDSPDDEDTATVEVHIDDGRNGFVTMPRAALDEPWVPCPINDTEALEQWLKT